MSFFCCWNKRDRADKPVQVGANSRCLLPDDILLSLYQLKEWRFETLSPSYSYPYQSKNNVKDSPTFNNPTLSDQFESNPGYQAVHVMGMLPAGVVAHTVTNDTAAICSLTGVSPEDILLSVTEGQLYRPGHFVAVSRDTKQVLLSIFHAFTLCDWALFASIPRFTLCANGYVLIRF